VSVPNATEFAPIVSATSVTLAVPSIEKEPVTSPVAKVTDLDANHFPAAPAFTAVPALPAVTEVPAEPAFTAVPALPAVTEVPAEPAVTDVPADPAVTEVPAEPAVVEVVAFPENVVAVIVLPRAEIPLSTKIAVPAKPVEDLEPSKYNVLVVSVLVVITCEEVAVPLNGPKKLEAVIAVPEMFVEFNVTKPVTVRAVPPKVNVELPNVVVELVKEALGIFVAPKDAESPEALTSNVIPTPATKVNVSIAASGWAIFVPSDQ